MDSSVLEETIRLLGWLSVKSTTDLPDHVPIRTVPLNNTKEREKYLIPELRGILRSYHEALHRVRSSNAQLEERISKFEFASEIPGEEEISDHTEVEGIRRRLLEKLLAWNSFCFV